MKKLYIVLLIVLLSSCSKAASYHVDDTLAQMGLSDDAIWMEEFTLAFAQGELELLGYEDMMPEDIVLEDEIALAVLSETEDGIDTFVFIPKNDEISPIVIPSPFPDFDLIIRTVNGMKDEHFHGLDGEDMYLSWGTNYANFFDLRDTVILRSDDIYESLLDSYFATTIGTYDKTGFLASGEYDVSVIAYNNGYKVIRHTSIDETSENESIWVWFIIKTE